MRNDRSRHVFSYLLLLLGMEMVVMARKEATIPVNIGVIVDESDIGKVWVSCMNTSLSDFYASRGRHYKTRLLLNYRDSKKDVVGATGAALDLIKNVEVQAILGPAKSTQANIVIQLGEKAQVPVISFSASTPTLTSIPSPYFFQATQNDKTQADAITATVEAFGWKQAVPIYVDNDYGAGVIPYLSNVLVAVGIHVPYMSAISPAATDDQILEELYKLMSLQTKVFILHMYPSLGIRIFDKAKQIGMMDEGYVWIMTDGMTILLDSSPHRSIFDSMQSTVLGLKPYLPKTKELENFEDRWKRKFHQENPNIADAELNIYGLWAYDAMTAVAIAVEKIAGTTESFSYERENVSRNPSTDFETLGVSKKGPKLAQALSNSSFKGLTGDFIFVNQHLQPSAFQIVNIGGGPSWTEIWIPKQGFSTKLLSLTNIREDSTTKSNQPKYTCVPMAAQIQSNSWLRIGVPVKEGFREYVNVTTDKVTGEVTVDGLCIKIFDAAMKEIENHPPYCYIPFAKPDGKSAGNYNDLVHQLYLKRYNAVVGDVSIIARRAQYVQFTLPYMEYGPIQMIVANKKSDNSWVLFKPLTWKLWVTTFCFFDFIGFVVWILEHGKNNEFQGSASSQFGVSFWFAFSIMVFAHKERITNNWSRVVVIISCFVVLLITQSYSAALSSYLTVQQLQPDIDDVKKLIKKNVAVGYQDGSFVHETLRRWGFPKRNLRPYKSSEQCINFLSKGVKNGGIAAAFEEIPYVNLILEKDCRKYAPVQPKLDNYLFQPDGFGFVFPRGSSLATDVSTQILRLIENNTIKDYENIWLGNPTECSVDNSGNGSDKLGIDSFWVLFLFAAIVSFSALFFHGVKLAYKWHAEILENVGGNENDPVTAPSSDPPPSSTSSPDNSIHGDQEGANSPENPNAQTPPDQVELINIVNRQRPASTEISHETNS